MIELWESLRVALANSVPSIAAAVGILVVGWLAAMLVAKLVRSGLRRTTLDDRLA
jgi:hypothetical protein